MLISDVFSGFKYVNATGTSWTVLTQPISPEQSKLVLIPWLIGLQQPFS